MPAHGGTFKVSVHDGTGTNVCVYSTLLCCISFSEMY